jgi:hypothetical protein
MVQLITDKFEKKALRDVQETFDFLSKDSFGKLKPFYFSTVAEISA